MIFAESSSQYLNTGLPSIESHSESYPQRSTPVFSRSFYAPHKSYEWFEEAKLIKHEILAFESFLYSTPSHFDLFLIVHWSNSLVFLKSG